MTIMLQTTPPDPAALARRPDPAGPLAVATPTTRKLADASLSVNTRRAYAGAADADATHTSVSAVIRDAAGARAAIDERCPEKASERPTERGRLG